MTELVFFREFPTHLGAKRREGVAVSPLQNWRIGKNAPKWRWLTLDGQGAG